MPRKVSTSAQICCDLVDLSIIIKVHPACNTSSCGSSRMQSIYKLIYLAEVLPRHKSAQKIIAVPKRTMPDHKETLSLRQCTYSALLVARKAHANEKYHRLSYFIVEDKDNKHFIHTRCALARIAIVTCAPRDTQRTTRNAICVRRGTNDDDRT